MLGARPLNEVGDLARSRGTRPTPTGGGGFTLLLGVVAFSTGPAPATTATKGGDIGVLLAMGCAEMSPIMSN